MRPRRPLRRRQGCQLRCCPLRRERRAAPRANAAPKALTSPQWSLPAKRRGSRARPNGKNHPATKKLAYPDGAVPGPCGAGSEQARFRRARTSPARATPPNDGCTANPWHSMMARSSGQAMRRRRKRAGLFACENTDALWTKSTMVFTEHRSRDRNPCHLSVTQSASASAEREAGDACGSEAKTRLGERALGTGATGERPGRGGGTRQR